MKGGIIQQLDDPLTIFNKPKNLFVAGFIGSPAMNFLTGELSAEGGLRFLGQGLDIPLAGYAAAGALQPGRKVVLGLRPEHIRFDEAAQGHPDARPGEVEMEEPMGSDSLVWLKAGQATLTVRSLSGKRYHAGDRVPFALDLSRASLFDAETQDRL
jgi:multiple sugar transport system ATP-binding protein